MLYAESNAPSAQPQELCLKIATIQKWKQGAWHQESSSELPRLTKDYEPTPCQWVQVNYKNTESVMSKYQWFRDAIPRGRHSQGTLFPAFITPRACNR